MDQKEFLKLLEERFNKNMHRHKNHKWETVLSKINDENIKVLINMEESNGEIDVVDLYDDHKRVVFVDCSKESPGGIRRSLCYDNEALNSRKENKPKDSAINLSTKIGSTILDETEYRKLQEFEDFDLKTSTWVKTPENIRKLGGAIFCDKRYNQVFMYHNGAESYYGSRGFRTKLEL